MSESNLHNADALFKVEFDQIEVRFNPLHWQQLQNALQQPSADTSEIPSKANGRKISFKLIVFASMIVIGMLVLIYFLKQNSDYAKPIHPNAPAVQPIKSESEVNSEGETRTDFPKSNAEDVQLNPAVKAEERVGLSDTLPKKRKSGVISDTLKKDTTQNPLDNFIFW
jgi:hypothetical protein